MAEPSEPTAPTGPGDDLPVDVEALVGHVEPETLTEQELAAEREACQGAGVETTLAFHATCAADKYDAVRKLMRKGQDVNAEDHFGRVALHAACLHGKEDIVSLLLKAGADPDAEEERYENTPLHLATISASQECIALLLAHGADVDAQNGKGLTALMLAARAGQEDILALLITHAEFPEHVDAKGWSALHYSAWQGLETAAKGLLERGADSWQKTKDCGATPLDLAEAYGHKCCVDLLVRWQAEHRREDAAARLL